MQSTVHFTSQLKIKIPQVEEFLETEKKDEQLKELNWDSVFHIIIPEIVINNEKKENFIEMDWDSVQFNQVYQHQDCDYEYDCVDGIYE